MERWATPDEIVQFARFFVSAKSSFSVGEKIIIL